MNEPRKAQDRDAVGVGADGPWPRAMFTFIRNEPGGGSHQVPKPGVPPQGRSRPGPARTQDTTAIDGALQAQTRQHGLGTARANGRVGRVHWASSPGKQRSIPGGHPSSGLLMGGEDGPVPRQRRIRWARIGLLVRAPGVQVCSAPTSLLKDGL